LGSKNGSKKRAHATPDELEGRLTALEQALAIALEGRRLNPEYAQAAAPN